MQIMKSYYGDFVARDELAFSMHDLNKAIFRIAVQYKAHVMHWPMTIQYFNGYWEVHFLRPLAEEPVEAVQSLPESV